MNKKIVCLQGLPASGKSTYAKKLVSENDYIRVNKDDIREVLHEGVYSKENEAKVVLFERTTAELALMAGENLVVDNTHLDSKRGHKRCKHIEFYRDLAKKYNYDFEIKQFYISIEDAIERDSKREDKDPVGEAVIKRMASRAVLPGKHPENPYFIEYDKELKPCIICDIDGTMAFMRGKRSPYDYSKVQGDELNKYLSDLVQIMRYSTGNEIIFLSGRSDECRKETRTWLDDNGFEGCQLHMRKKGDTRCDTIIKEELYREHIEGEYSVFAVFDDRDRVISKWRELGLPTYQVWYGNF